MLNKNIKNINKMLVKSNDNMFGGSTKRPPPPPPPPPSSSAAAAATATPSPSSASSPVLLLSLSSTSSSLLTPPRTAEHKTKLSSQQQGLFSLRPLSSPSSPPPPSPVKLTPLSAGAKLAGVSSVISSKSMSVSFSPHSTSSLSSPSSSTSSSSSSSLSASLQTTPPREAAAAAAAASSSTLLSGRTKLLQQQQRQRHRQIQQQQQQQYHHHHHHHHHHTPQLRFRLLPGLKATSFFTILTLVCLETVLLSTVSNCAKTFYMHWNTSNSIFRIDNTDHIIDVNKGNLAFEFDQVHIICPVYEPGTFENETEKYIIYNVSKVEYETCRITNADPRVIAICDKPQKLMFFTITFRPFTPQPGGLEFLPGNDYYFISTSSKDDLYRRIGGRCSTNNMKVVFKVCCAPEDKNNRTNNNIGGGSGSGGGIGNGGGNSGIGSGNTGSSNSNTAIQQQHNNNININGGNIGGGGQLPSPKLPGMGGGGGGMGGNNGIGIGMNNGGGLMINGNSGTSINTNIDQFNRIPMQQPNNIGSNNGMGMGGIGNGGVNGQHQTGIRINNVPSSQQHPSQKNGMHGGFISPMAANINTNSSNVVQSTISWPDWGNHNNHNGDHGGGGVGDGNAGGSGSGSGTDGRINVQQHSTPVSTIGIHPHFYPSHITSPRPNINSAVNNNSNYSPSHKPTKKTNDYDKHPNEVVKNEELTYNSAASSLTFFKMTRRRTFIRGGGGAVTVAGDDDDTAEAETTLMLRKNLRYNKSTYKSIYQKFKSLLQLLLFTSNHRNRINTINTFINFISNCNPIIITTTVLVTLTNLFQYKLSSWSLRRSSNSPKATKSTSQSTKTSTSSTVAVATRRHNNKNMPSIIFNKTPPPTQQQQPPPPPQLSPVDCIKNDTVDTLSKTLNIDLSTR